VEEVEFPPPAVEQTVKQVRHQIPLGIVNRCKKAVARKARAIIGIAKAIHADPELGYREFHAVTRLTAYLSRLGFRVTVPYVKLKTAFRAVLDSGRKGPAVAVIAEYDALAGLGHGCGHNLISAAALAAAAGMAGSRGGWRGSFEVIGTPAEEMYAGKGIMVGRGGFKHLKSCFMVHPSSRSMRTPGSNALETVTVRFRGKSAHAAVNPDEGINALDAAVLFINALNALRQHLREDARIHAIVTEGGRAVNVIPELAEVKAVVRSCDEEYVKVLRRRVESAARGAAMAIGAKVALRWDSEGYRSFLVNEGLDDLLANAMRVSGIAQDMPSVKESRGSLDMGNVSRLVPSAHPFFSIVPPGKRPLALHTRDFLRQANTAFAYRQALKAGTGMALAAVRLLS